MSDQSNDKVTRFLKINAKTPNQFIFYKRNIQDNTYPSPSVDWKAGVERIMLELPDGNIKITVEATY